MSDKYIHCIIILKRCFHNIFGLHYPKEIIIFIINLYIKINNSYNISHVINSIFFQDLYSDQILQFTEEKLINVVPDENLIQNDPFNSVILEKILTLTSISISCNKNIINDNILSKIKSDKIIFIEYEAERIFFLTKSQKLYVCRGDKSAELDWFKHTKILSMKSGDDHTIFLTVTNDCYACGSNGSGQLGLGDRKSHKQPQKINISDIIQISSGSRYCSVLNKGHDAFIWGRFINFPMKLDIQNVISISSGQCGSIYLTNIGEIWVCKFIFNDVNGKIEFSPPQKIILSDKIYIELIYSTHHYTFMMTKNREIYILKDKTMVNTGLSL